MSKYKILYLSSVVIEADSEKEAQRKFVEHIEKCPGAVTGVFGRFLSLHEAWFQFCKLDGYSDEDAKAFIEKISPAPEGDR